MSYETNMIVNGEFCISNEVCLDTYKQCWYTHFITEKDNKCIKWKLIAAKSIYNYWTVYLTFVSSNPDCNNVKVSCDFNISFRSIKLNTKGDPVQAYNIKKNEIKNYLKLEQLPIYTSNEQFFVNKYNFKIWGTIIEVHDTSNFSINIEAIPTNVLKNYESLFIDKKFCDVTFETADICISAHKIILAAQSSFFNNMFSNHMLENTPSAVVSVKDIEGDVLNEMLRFMYGGQVMDNIANMADKLLILANRYDVKPLMTLCEKVLYDQLTCSNAISMIKLADLHNAKNLRSLIEEFIIKNKTSLFDTVEFKSLLTTNPEIVLDILKAQ